MSGKREDQLKAGDLSLEWTDGERGFITRGRERRPFSTAVAGAATWVRWEGRTYRIENVTNGSSGGPEREGPSSDTRAPISGVVIAVGVRPGDEVARGALLLSLEAMKMEHEVRALRPARVRSVLVAEGDRVEAGARLIDLEALSGDQEGGGEDREGES